MPRIALLACVLCALTSAQPALTDYDAVAGSLFGNPAVTCAAVAASASNFCSTHPSSPFISFVCPVACSRAADPLEYCVNQNAVLFAQYSADCSAATTTSCVQPAVALVCPEACGTQDASCPAVIDSPPPPPPAPPATPPPSSPPPCAEYCNVYSCDDPRCTSCSVCAVAFPRCDSFCNSWTCFESMPFFRDHCGGCSDCQTLQSGGALCDAWCNSHTCGFTSRCGACEACGATPPTPPCADDATFVGPYGGGCAGWLVNGASDCSTGSSGYVVSCPADTSSSGTTATGASVPAVDSYGTACEVGGLYYSGYWTAAQTSAIRAACPLTCGTCTASSPARRQLVDATSSGGEGAGKTTELKTKGTFTHRGLAVPVSTAGPGVIGAMAGVTAVLTALAAFRYLTTRTSKPATHLAPTKSGAYEADESSVAIETEKLHHRRQSRTSDDTVTD